MKYRPEFPKRFGCYQDAHRFCAEFFPWYNHEHHHSGLRYLTPHEVHYGLAQAKKMVPGIGCLIICLSRGLR